MLNLCFCEDLADLKPLAACKSLTSLDLYLLNSSPVLRGIYALAACSSLVDLYVSAEVDHRYGGGLDLLPTRLKDLTVSWDPSCADCWDYEEEQQEVYVSSSDTIDTEDDDGINA